MINDALYRKMPVARFLREAHGRSVQLSKGSKTNDAADATDFYSDLRSLIGRPIGARAKAGGHPDFDHLSADDYEQAPITSVIIDLKGSTFLPLRMEKISASKLKQALLESATQVFQAFDGVVHRFQGDGLLIFFGRTSQDPSVGALDALNATSMMMTLVESYLNPELESRGWESIGLRAGIDHEPESIWTLYGSGGCHEITADGVHVSLAAKLQHRAGKGRIMVGDNIRDLLDFPSEFLKVKSVSRGGKMVEKPLIVDRPDLRYRMWIFDWRNYVKQFPWVREIGGRLEVTKERNLIVEPLRAEIINAVGTRIRDYRSSLSVLPKGLKLRFMLNPNAFSRIKTIKWWVQNFGKEATDADQLKWTLPEEDGRHWVQRDTSYHGRHILGCHVECWNGDSHRFELFVVVGPHYAPGISSSRSPHSAGHHPSLAGA